MSFSLFVRRIGGGTPCVKRLSTWSTRGGSLGVKKNAGTVEFECKGGKAVQFENDLNATRRERDVLRA